MPTRKTTYLAARTFCLAIAVLAAAGARVLAEVGAGAPTTQVGADHSATAGRPTAPTTHPVSIDVRTPRGAVRTLAAALYAGDADALHVALYTGTTDSERDMTTATIDMAVAMATFRQAAVDQFGDADVRDALADPAGQQTAATARIDSAVEAITGETATLGQPGEPPVVLRRVGNGWAVVTGAVSTSDSPPAIAERVRGIQRQAEVFRFMAEDIRADRHRSMREVLTLLHGQMMKAATEPRAAGGEVAPVTTGPAE